MSTVKMVTVAFVGSVRLEGREMGSQLLSAVCSSKNPADFQAQSLAWGFYLPLQRAKCVFTKREAVKAWLFAEDVGRHESSIIQSIWDLVSLQTLGFPLSHLAHAVWLQIYSPKGDLLRFLLQ